MLNKTFILLGATGSLAKAKIIPFLNGADANIVLYARSPIETKYNFVIGDLNNFTNLSKFLTSKKMVELYFYLALPPNLFAVTIQSLKKYFSRQNIHIALEKPFGTSLAEANKLAFLIRKFGTDKFYLVDHYLAKESLTKFLNLPEPVRRSTINLKNIEGIQVSLLEEDDVSERAAFYDKVGAIKDTGQNHLLNILSAFINPENKLQVLKNLIYVPNSLVTKQYKGYRKIVGVKSDSKTETYFRAMYNYSGIGIVLETGKAMPKTKTFIRVFYKNGRTFDLIIKPNPRELKTAHERVIDDFLNGGNMYSLKIEEALESWRTINQIYAASCQIYCKVNYKNRAFAYL